MFSLTSSLRCVPAVGQEVDSSQGNSLDEKTGTIFVFPICVHLALL